MLTQLAICVLPREGPREAAAFGVTALLPSGHFNSEQRAVWQASVKALAIKDPDFDFRHVEPAGVLRGVVEDDTAEQVSRRADAEHGLEADAKVGAEIVENQVDAPCVRVDVFEQVLDEGNEIDFGPVIGNLDHPSSALGFHRHEQIAGAGAGILVVLLRRRPRLHRQGSARIPEQLFALLVHADHRLLAPERPGIQCKQVVHALPVLRGQCTDAPHQLAPRLEAVFFSSRRMVSRLIGPIPACDCAACSSKTKVQRLAPGGGAEQAKAVICASTSVSYWRGLPGRATSCRAYSRPPCKYAARVRQMAVRPTPNTSMIWASERPRSRAARMCARLNSRAECI